MGGKKGRSGPPGNLHGSKHPWRAFWRRRALRPEDQWIANVIASYAPGLLSDKPEASEALKRVTELAQAARGCLLLCFAQIGREGLFTPDGTLTPAGEAVTRFGMMELRALQTVGMERAAKPVPTLADVIAAHAKGSQAAHSDDEAPEGG